MDRILNYLADKTRMLIADGLQVPTDGAAFSVCSERIVGYSVAI